MPHLSSPIPRPFRYPVLLLASLLAVGLAASNGCRRKADTPAPTVVAAVNRGVGLMGQYDYDGASKAFEQALAESPDLPDVQVNLAIARFNRGKKENQDIEEATRLVEAVIQKHPDDARAWYFKGIILQHLGQAEGAVPCFEKVLELRPDDGVAWYLLGLCQQRVSRDPQKALLRAVELRPYLASAYYRLWQTLQAAGKSVDAAPYLERFKQLKDNALAETIELPQYNQMGELALVVPIGAAPAPAVASYKAGVAGTVTPALTQDRGDTPTEPDGKFGGAAFVDAKDGSSVRVLPSVAGASSAVSAGTFLLSSAGKEVAAPEPFEFSGLEGVSCWAVGDYDNDEVPDLFVVDRRGPLLFHGTADGKFKSAGELLAQPSAGGRTVSALWYDTDHDGDLDLFVCNSGAPNQLFQNNSDGTFREIAAAAGVAETGRNSVAVIPGDLDGDGDCDLVLLRDRASATLLVNELAGRFREAAPGGDIRGERGGVLQDFDGDGRLDLLVLGGETAVLSLFKGDGLGHLERVSTFPARGSLPSDLRAFRIADVDLDGDLDIAVFNREGHLLLNDSRGNFTLQRNVWTASPGAEIAGAELTDLTGDFVPDLLLFEKGTRNPASLVPGVLTPARTALSLAPTGVRTRDKRTRSPASGYGVQVTVRSGMQQQTLLSTGQGGSFNQSPRPLLFGLRHETKADYARLIWSDAVAQVETALPAGHRHAVAESQRKISSCPLLFTWNGNRYEFITDFAGVGGLGYFVGPGEYANPQPLDHVKIEPSQLAARNGSYELRITEAMEESAYVDRLELVAIDHPADWVVFPDERLAVTGPAPTHELLAVAKPLFALRATGPEGIDCTQALTRVDRHYAYEPKLDRRFFGFCQRHTLELDFGDQLSTANATDRVFLFITGYLEYPYSQTAYAAGQAGVGWEPIRVERQQPDGTWTTIVPDAGALGGMSRTMTVDLTHLIDGPACRLRLISNLELFYDQVFLGSPVDSERVVPRTLAVTTAELHPVGFAQEVSPDGRHPLIYDYQQTEATAPFNVLRGAYTRYGEVRELLTDFDDQFVLMAPGDEIATTFDATALPTLPAGFARSFVLVSHAYCKDMDLYTAEQETLEPMPFRGMTKYPYPHYEGPVETEALRRLRALYQTRIVK